MNLQSYCTATYKILKCKIAQELPQYYINNNLNVSLKNESLYKKTKKQTNKQTVKR